MSLTIEQFEAIKSELAQPGHRTISAIAASLGVSKGTVIGRLHRAGVRTGRSPSDVQNALDEQRERIVALAEMGASSWAIAREIGVSDWTMKRYCERQGIEIRVHVPSAKNVGARRALAGTFGRSRPLHPRDRKEMDRLRDEALAAGRITKLPPGVAYGALKWGRSEYSA